MPVSSPVSRPWVFVTDVESFRACSVLRDVLRIIDAQIKVMVMKGVAERQIARVAMAMAVMTMALKADAMKMK